MILQSVMNLLNNPDNCITKKYQISNLEVVYKYFIKLND